MLGAHKALSVFALIPEYITMDKPKHFEQARDYASIAIPAVYQATPYYFLVVLNDFSIAEVSITLCLN